MCAALERLNLLQVIFFFVSCDFGAKRVINSVCAHAHVGKIDENFSRVEMWDEESVKNIMLHFWLPVCLPCIHALHGRHRSSAFIKGPYICIYTYIYIYLHIHAQLALCVHAVKERIYWVRIYYHYEHFETESTCSVWKYAATENRYSVSYHIHTTGKGDNPSHAHSSMLVRIAEGRNRVGCISLSVRFRKYFVIFLLISILTVPHSARFHDSLYDRSYSPQWGTADWN